MEELIRESIHIESFVFTGPYCLVGVLCIFTGGRLQALLLLCGEAAREDSVGMPAGPCRKHGLEACRVDRVTFSMSPLPSRQASVGLLRLLHWMVNHTFEYND